MPTSVHPRAGPHHAQWHMNVLARKEPTDVVHCGVGRRGKVLVMKASEM